MYFVNILTNFVFSFPTNLNDIQLLLLSYFIILSEHKRVENLWEGLKTVGPKNEIFRLSKELQI